MSKKYLFFSIVLLISSNSLFSQAYFKEKFSTNDDTTLIIIPVNIDGETFSFLFDTGSQVNLLFDDGSFDLTKARKTKIFNSNNESTNALLIKKKIELQSLKIKKKSLCVVLNEKPDFMKELNIHGILGANIINKFDWKIDFKKLEISRIKNIKKSSINISDSSFYKINTFFDENYTLSTSINLKNDKNDSVTFIFDTGYTGIINIYLNSNEILNKTFLYKNIGIENTLVSSKIDTSFISLDTIIVGDFCIERIPIMYSKSNQSETNSIGMKFLNTFNDVYILNSKNLVMVSKIELKKYNIQSYKEFKGIIMSQTTLIEDSSTIVLGKKSTEVKNENVFIDIPVTKFIHSVNKTPMHNIK